MNINKKKNEEIGERLISVRKALNKSQAVFAVDLGFKTGNGLSMIEKGNNPLQVAHYIILQNVFNVNIEWLKTGAGKMFLNDNQDKSTGFYYPNVSASAGLERGLENSELSKVPIYIPSFGNDTSFVNVYGDSMYPKFCSGEIIGISEVEKDFL